jgi:hypothetical protein
VKWLNDKHLNPNKRWPTEALPLENYLFHTIRACGECSSNAKSRFLEVLNFRHFYEYYTFAPVNDFARNKQIKDYVMVAVVFRVDAVDTSAN